MPQTLFGHLGFQDRATPFANPASLAVFYEETVRLLRQYNADTAAVSQFLISKVTEEVQELYAQQAVGGMMQARGGLEQSKAVKGFAGYTIGYPIGEFGDQIAADKIGVLSLTAEQYDTHVQTVFKRHSARRRYEMLRRLFNNTSETFTDPKFGTVTVYPLANGDAFVYPTGVGGGPTSTANHYIGANYTAITDVNNPFKLIVAKLARIFGNIAGGQPILTFINSAQTAETEALAAFVPIYDRYIQEPTTVATLRNLPVLPGSANLIGRTNGTWVAEWDAAVDPGYMLGFHLAVDPPLAERRDPAAWGIPAGLHVTATSSGDAESYPFEQRHFLDRVGYGARNRLNGVVLQLVASTTYTPPAQYA